MYRNGWNPVVVPTITHTPAGSVCVVHQVALFSATMPLDVLEVTNRFMPDPVRILVKKDELTLEGELLCSLRHGLSTPLRLMRSTDLVASSDTPHSNVLICQDMDPPCGTSIRGVSIVVYWIKSSRV